MGEKWADTDKHCWNRDLQSSFQDTFCTFITGLDGYYNPCTAIPSKIYIHTQVWGMCSSKVHGYVKVLRMYLLGHVHTNICCYRRLQKECVWTHRLISHLHFWCYLKRKSEMRSTGLLNKFNWKCLYLLYVLSIISSGQSWNESSMFMNERTSGKFSW